MPKPLCRMKYLAHLEYDRDRISELTRAAFDRNLAYRFRLRGHDAHRHRAGRRRSRLGPFGDHHRAAEDPTGSLSQQHRFRARIVECRAQTLIAPARWIGDFEVQSRSFVDSSRPAAPMSFFVTVTEFEA